MTQCLLANSFRSWALDLLKLFRICATTYLVYLLNIENILSPGFRILVELLHSKVEHRVCAAVTQCQIKKSGEILKGPVYKVMLEE